MISAVLSLNSSLNIYVKAILISLILCQFYKDLIYQSPCTTIKELKLTSNEWILKMQNGSMQHYDKSRILIHNVLFQLIQLSTPQKNKILILFNDQVPSEQLRIIHLKQLNNRL